jgi:hypothetical protein
MSVSATEPRASGTPRAGEQRAADLPLVLLVGVVCLAVAGIADALLRHEKGITGDEPAYVGMATDPGAAHSFPYAYRIAVPWLVHALPFSEGVSFQLLALLGIAASGAAMYALMREFELSPWLAGALCVGFAVSPILLVVLLRNGRSIDPASILIMVLGCLFIVRRQRLALAVTVLIGVAVKETSFFLIPFAYAVWARQLFDRQALRDTALIAAGPIAVYILIRTSMSAIGSQYTPEYAGPFLKARIDVFRQVFTGVELRRLAYTFGPVWLIAPFALRSLPFARRGLVLVALCVISMTVSFDAGRVIFLAAPIFYIAAGSIIEHRRRLAVLTVVALCALDVGYAVYMQTYGVAHGIDTSLSTPTPLH